MGSWRIFTAIGVLGGSYFVLFCGMIYFPIPTVQVFFLFLSFLLGMIALGFAQDDGIKRANLCDARGRFMKKDQDARKDKK